MRKATFIVFVVVLAGDLILKGWADPKATLLGNHELGLLALMIFVGAGDRIVEFVVGKAGLKIKQNVEKQAREAEKDMSTLASIGRDPRPDVVDKLLSGATGQDKDVWSRLVVYRLTMRLLLRRLCASFGMKLNDTTAFVTMLTFLKEKAAIPEKLRKNIEDVRDATFFFEWGTGRSPSASQIKDTLEIAPKVIKELESIVTRDQKAGATTDRSKT